MHTTTIKKVHLRKGIKRGNRGKSKPTLLKPSIADNKEKNLTMSKVKSNKNMIVITVGILTKIKVNTKRSSH